jgi:hypothetical protein
LQEFIRIERLGKEMDDEGNAEGRDRSIERVDYSCSQTGQQAGSPSFGKRLAGAQYIYRSYRHCDNQSGGQPAQY